MVYFSSEQVAVKEIRTRDYRSTKLIKEHKLINYMIISGQLDEQIALVTIFFSAQAFYFLQVNQQKHVGMVSTYNF